MNVAQKSMNVPAMLTVPTVSGVIPALVSLDIVGMGEPAWTLMSVKRQRLITVTLWRTALMKLVPSYAAASRVGVEVELFA